MCVTGHVNKREHGARGNCGFFRSVRPPGGLNNSCLDPMTACFSVHLPTGPSVSVPSLRALLRLLDEKIINHRLILQDLHLVLLAKLKYSQRAGLLVGGVQEAKGTLGHGEEEVCLEGAWAQSLGEEKGGGGALALSHCGLTM